jgi:hypothetical protein
MVTEDTLYLRVDDHNRVTFKEAESSPPLNYQKQGSIIDLSFWRVPERLIDEPDELLTWVQAALAAARRVAAKRERATPRRRSRPRATRSRRTTTLPRRRVAPRGADLQAMARDAKRCVPTWISAQPRAQPHVPRLHREVGPWTQSSISSA